MKSRVEDLHGFDVLTAVDFTMRRVREAYQNGYGTIEFKHGAGNVGEHVDEGRGRIKWELRRLLERGALDEWCDRRSSWPKSASLVVALRRNPRPQPESWSPAPRRAYGR